MVEDTIQDDPDPSGMSLTDQFGQQAVRSLQVGRVCRPGNISAGMDVPVVSFFQQGPCVPDDPAEMRVDMVIVLGVMLEKNIFLMTNSNSLDNYKPSLYL